MTSLRPTVLPPRDEERMNANDLHRSTHGRKALPLVRVTLAFRKEDESLRDYLVRYRSEGVFIAADRVRPVGERICFKIHLVDGSADYTSEAVVVAHERKGLKLGMRLRLEPPQLAAKGLAPGGLEPPWLATSADEVTPSLDGALQLRDDRPLAVSLAEYICEAGETRAAPLPDPLPAGAGRGGPWPETSGEGRIEGVPFPGEALPPMRAQEPVEAEPCIHDGANHRESVDRHPMEAVEVLHRTFVKTRDLEPATAMAAAGAMLALARADPGGQLVRFVRRLTRGGHEILELALERMECARSPESHSEAQQLFDDALRIVVVP